MYTLKNPVNKIHNRNIKNNINLELNGLRGLACLLIFFFHCWILSGSPDIRPALGILYLLPLHGAYAVDLFFVLSGFFIILPYVEIDGKPLRKVTLSEYYKKKFVRIFPPYYINLLVMFGVVVPIVLGSDFLFSTHGMQMLLAHLSFLQYLHPASSSSLGMNGALWTLSISFQFFLIFPFIKNMFIGGKKKIFLYLVIFIIISVWWKYQAWFNMDLLLKIAMNSVSQYGVDEFTIRFFLSNQLPGNLSHFAIGMFVGNLYINNKHKKVKISKSVNIVILAGFILALYSFKISNLSLPPWWYIWRLCLAIGAGCLIYLTAIDGPKIFKTVLQNKYLGCIGNLSYEIYLWHVLVLYILGKILLVEVVNGINLFWTFLFLGGGITLIISFTSINFLAWIISYIKSKVLLNSSRKIDSHGTSPTKFNTGQP
jgi:peptidoglycan/LPS O-acetylase OafA/YrhL